MENEEKKPGGLDLFGFDGLAKILPVDKLLDLVSKGLGRLTKAYYDKKDIDIEAYRIRVLSQANAEATANEMKTVAKGMNESFRLTDGIEYKSDRLAFSSPKEIPKEIIVIPSEETKLPMQTQLTEPSTLSERTQDRITYQEEKKQLNLEKIIGAAAEELKNEEPVSNQPVDEDWTTRFFKYAEDVSNEEMQTLWAKILAGEVKNPKTYSLRTLEVLRNLSKDEAELLVKASEFCIKRVRLGDKIENLIYVPQSEEEKESINFPTYAEFSLLSEAGLIQLGPFLNINYKTAQGGEQIPFILGKYVLLMNRKPNSPAFQLPVYVFTKTGNELLTLINTDASIPYINKIADFLSNHDNIVQYAPLKNVKSQHISIIPPLMNFPIPFSINNF
jgi:uncharacterized repeat protein (TIGR03899 family)